MTEITNKHLTEGIVNGAGVFDTLMDAVNTHLDVQYKAGRITGKDYANVYLGSMQATLAQAVAFLLGKEQAGNQADLTAQQTINAQTTNDTLLRQQGKIDAETGLLQQKRLSEEGQTKDVLSDGTVVYNPVNETGKGFLGKQQSVQQRQADGFTRDAEQKLTKILLDTWSIRRTTDEGTAADPAGIGDGEIAEVVAKAKAGIDVL